MSEPDPFASPYHRVDLPGQAGAPLPPGYALPAPMPAVGPQELPPARPVTSTAAFWCWVAGAVLTVLVLPGLVYSGVDVLTDELLRDPSTGNDPMGRGEAELVARLTPVFVGFGLGVLSVPYLIAAFKLRSGRRWARVVLTALAPISLLFGFLMLLAFASGRVRYVHWSLGVAWSVVFLGVCALGVVTMYLPASNAYTRAVTR
ncbi:hypothetical protein AB0G02_03225 [Actinosynnema sp. NPDC023658]|uniref:hypothetical protein n=1 Tax=Actinosynnema sp. NPDC023658 TaxID=3155465 RepID=UPI0033D26900